MSLTCASIQELLPLHLYGELRPPELTQVEEHLRGCAACQARWAQDQQLVDLIRLPEPVRAPLDVEGLLTRMETAAPAVTRPQESSHRLAMLLGCLVLLLLLATVLSTRWLVERYLATPTDPEPSTRIEPPRPPAPPPPPEPAPPSHRTSPAPLPLPPRPTADPIAVRQLLAATLTREPAPAPARIWQQLRRSGAEVEAILEGLVGEEEPPVARQALLVLAATSPARAVRAAGVALRREGVLRETALELLATSRHPLAITELARSWEVVGEGPTATALARQGSPRALRALARRVQRQALADQMPTPGLWEILEQLGPEVSEPLADICPELPAEVQRRLAPLVARKRTWSTRQALLAMLEDPTTACPAARLLASWGDAAALRPLLVCARAAPSEGQPRAREGLVELGRLDPGAMVRYLREELTMDGGHVDLLVAALQEAAPEELHRLLNRLVRRSSTHGVALRLARQMDSPEALQILLPLGSSRELGPRAVALVASRSGTDFDRILAAFLDTRHGAAPAREALVERTGVDRGPSRAAWLMHLHQGRTALPSPRRSM